jgi:hypothetical protein
MLFTNITSAKTLNKAFEGSIKNADNLKVASGYFGYPLIQALKPKLLNVARRGECKILIGMVFHSGLADKQLIELESLDNDLKKINNDSGVFISRQEYHGKVYHIAEKGDETLYIGSSNFSTHGFISRLECTVKIDDEAIKKESTAYLHYLFSKPTTSKLSDVCLKRKNRKVIPRPSNGLDSYKVSANAVPNKTRIVGFVDIELNVDKQPASSLNLFFDKGRKDGGGKYAPRPWFEIELSVSMKAIKNPFYPPTIPNPKKGGGKSRIGYFNAYFKKGQNNYKIKMVVSADNGKNIASHKDSGGRSTFGEYIKGQLEAANVLRIGERITSETLANYGRSTIKLSKIDDDNYFIEF